MFDGKDKHSAVIEQIGHLAEHRPDIPDIVQAHGGDGQVEGCGTGFEILDGAGHEPSPGSATRFLASASIFWEISTPTTQAALCCRQNAANLPKTHPRSRTRSPVSGGSRLGTSFRVVRDPKGTADALPFSKSR
jgi:hypothetical protein